MFLYLIGFYTLEIPQQYDRAKADEQMFSKQIDWGFIAKSLKEEKQRKVFLSLIGSYTLEICQYFDKAEAAEQICSK